MADEVRVGRDGVWIDTETDEVRVGRDGVYIESETPASGATIFRRRNMAGGTQKLSGGLQ